MSDSWILGGNGFPLPNGETLLYSELQRFPVAGRAVEYAAWMIQNKTSIRYDQSGKRVNLPILKLPIATDCSGSIGTCYQWAGGLELMQSKAPSIYKNVKYAFDINSFSTGTIKSYFPRVPVSNLEPGDLFLYHENGRDHVSMLLKINTKVGANDPKRYVLFSHGTPGDPRVIPTKVGPVVIGKNNSYWNYNKMGSKIKPVGFYRWPGRGSASQVFTPGSHGSQYGG